MRSVPAEQTCHPQPPGRSRGGLTLRRLAFVVLVSFATACSVVGALYERLDLLLGLEAREWLDLDETQMHDFRRAARLRIEENRREELPEYIAFLELAATRVESPPDAATLQADAEKLRLLLRGTVRRSLPMIADTLASLHPGQVQHLAEQFAESNAEYAEDYLEIAPERFRKNRLRRSREAIERWTGRLDPLQREQVAELVDAVPDGSAAWSAYSQSWQQSLLAELRAGADSERLQALTEQWWTTDAAMDPAYVAQLEENRHIIAGSVARLLPTLTQRQRTRAAAEFRGLAADLRELLRPVEEEQQP